MTIYFASFVMLWALLAFAVLALLAYRKVVSYREEEALHLYDLVEINRQTGICHKLDVIDKWGKLLTITAFVYGLLLVAAYSYQYWLTASAVQ